MDNQPKTVGLSGLIPSRNCLSQDYCLELAIRSLLPICDEIVVSDSDSTDGTLEMLNEWASREPRLRIVNYPWPDPKGDYHWYVTWLNHARQHLRFRSLCQLDGDEVLTDEPSAYRIIRKAVLDNDALAVDRLNFARNAHSIIPEGECCGKYCVRVGPSDLFLASDEPHLPGEVPMLDMAHIEKGVRIYHLGFLRKPQAFFAKSKVVLGAFFNEYDKRIADAEEKGRLPLERFPWWNRLVPYNGYYPQKVKDWMIERGHRP